ncbi:hypothetical protein Barb4_00469 [Bacteroidales bacterium Barb4]|nr:hypothetical protein Barb4_00469 [Bacteroidales bacterium Barb4]
MGLRQVPINKVLKERYKLQTMIYNAIYIRSPFFRTSLSASSLTPHSASLYMGLKSFAPSGICVTSVIIQYDFKLCLNYGKSRKTSN